MRPSIDILNLLEIFAACFGHEICLKAFSMQKILMASAAAILYYVLSSLKSCYLNMLKSSSNLASIYL